jgi:SAM-dependent methyltransferase
MGSEPNAALQNFYEHRYFRDAALAVVPKEDDFVYAQVLRQLRPYMRPGLKVLDLGCNNGNLSMFIARAGCTVVGIDLAQNAIDSARESAVQLGIQGVTFVRMDFLKEWNEPDAFDLVLCSHVIEHVPDDVGFVRKIRFSLKENGVLLLFVPALSSSLYRANLLIRGRFPHDDEVGHLRRYTAESVSFVLEQAGFGIRKRVFLDGMLRDWFLLSKTLRVFNRVLGLPVIRRAFNGCDTLMASVAFPATICIHTSPLRKTHGDGI